MSIPSDIPTPPTTETEFISSNFKAPANLDDLYDYQSWFEGSAHFEMDTRYGYRDDGMAYGRYAFEESSKKLSIVRSEVSGPCSDSSPAPECPFTWGSAGTNKYWGASPTFYGFNQKIRKSFSKLRRIEAKITLRLLTGNMDGDGANGFSACNLTLGFGESTQENPDVPALPLDLSIAERSSYKDVIHFSYQIFQGGVDRFNIENRINNGIDPGYQANAIYETGFDLTEKSPLISNDDFVAYNMTLNFLQESEQIYVTLTPLETNKNLNLMEEQNIVWNYFGDVNAEVESEPRAGIAVDLPGNEPLTRSQFLESEVVVGFGSNGVTKECSIENLSIEWDL